MRAIDAHMHVWDPARARYPWLDPSSALHRRVDVDDVADELRASGVDGVVLVQAADSAEDTAYMLSVADRHPLVAGVVGWVPLDEPHDAAARLEVLVKDPRFVGVRNLTHDRADPDWLLRAAVGETLGLLAERGIPLDVVTRDPAGLAVIGDLIERHPDLEVVIDHLGKPRPDDDAGFAQWRTLIARCAAAPHVTAKLSGIPIGRDGAADSAGLRRIVDAALELFGADRLMAGSDWPITTSAGDLGAQRASLAGLLETLAPHEIAAVHGGTAERVYRLTPAPTRQDPWGGTHEICATR